MQKNIVLLISDGLDGKIFNEVEKLDNNLFLNNVENCIRVNNCFSLAPYTEGAVMSLYGGVRTLDFGGYFDTLNTIPKTLLEYMNDNDYQVFFNSMFIVPYTRSYCKNVKDAYYCGTFNTLSLWEYRFKYFQELYVNNQIMQNDYDKLVDMMSDYFAEWFKYLEMWKNDDEHIMLIKNITEPFDIDELKNNVEKEFVLFENSKIEYINAILLTGLEHNLFKVLGNYPLTSNKIKDKVVIDEILKTNANIISRIRRINKKYFDKKAVGCLFGIASNLIKCVFAKNSMEKAKKHYANYLLCKSKNNLPQLSKEYEMQKYEPCASSYYNHFVNWYKNTCDKSKPFFACIHTSDTHLPETFFDYDSDDIGKVNGQFNEMAKYLDKFEDSKSKRAVTYDLSIKYMDNCVKNLVKDYKTAGGDMDNTIFVFTSDHGNINSYENLRDKYVNSFYLENFRIPLIIFGGKLNDEVINNLSTSLDIPATIVDIASLDKPKHFKGASLLKKDDNNKNEMHLIEYLGPGCPDLNRKEIWYACFDKNYLVACKVKLSEEIDKNKVCEIYDLCKDEHQNKNIVKNLSKLAIDKYLQVISKRHAEIRSENLCK